MNMVEILATEFEMKQTHVANIIELIDGGNTMLLYAENENERQVIKIDITRLSKSQLDRINNLSVGDLFAFIN